jgi:hypothetical protein
VSSCRWPSPPKYCVWDCGNYWDGYDSPVHVGLDELLLKNYIENLKKWRDGDCYVRADAGKSCLKKANPTSPENAVMQATRSEYYQEVCGEYIDEDKKRLLDTPGAIGAAVFFASIFAGPIGGAAAVAVALGAAYGGVKNNVGAGVQSGINNKYTVNGVEKSFTSLYSDETARHVTDREYRYDAK